MSQPDRGNDLKIQVAPDLDDGGFIATVVGHPGIISDGETELEAVENAVDAYVCVLRAFAIVSDADVVEHNEPREHRVRFAVPA